MNERIAAGSAYCDVGSETRIVSRPSAWNPTGTLRQPREALQQQAGADEQHQRQRDLGDRRARCAAAPRRRGAARRRSSARRPATAGRRATTGPGRRRGRRPATRPARTRARGRSTAISDPRGRPAQRRRGEVDAPEREQHARERRRPARAATLSLHDPSRQVPAAGAERERAPPPRAIAPVARTQQQVGDVGAGDEQHEPDRAHQHQQRRPGAADRALANRHEPQARVRIGVGVGRVARARRRARWRPLRPAPARRATPGASRATAVR